MKKDTLKTDAPDLTSEACAWLAQLETGALSPEDLAAFREWVKRSPRHYAEIRRLARLSGEINVLAEMAGPLRDAAERRAPVLRSKIGSHAITWSAAAFAMLALIFAGALLFFSPVTTDAPGPYLIATEIGEVRETALADGSEVKLNTDSEIEIDFDRDQRRIRLLRGEAYFEVARNPDRPFTVYAGNKHVTAIGTAFAVRWTDDDLIVTVSEGKVSFDETVAPQLANPGSAKAFGGDEPKVAALAPAPRRLIEAGQRLAVSGSAALPVVNAISARNLTRELAWRSGLLDFEKAPLSEVVREMERYTTLDIEIVDDDLRDLKFGGIFRTGETDAFFEALELSFGVKVVRAGSDRVLLQRAG